MFNFFKKKNEGEAFDAKKLEMMLSIARSMGFDVYKKIEEAMPKLLAAYLGMEHQAGSRLMLVLTVADDSSHFVISQYGLQPDGAATLRRSFPINDVPALVEQMKATLTSNADNESDNPPESIAAPGNQLATRPAPDPGLEPDPYDFGYSARAQRQREQQQQPDPAAPGQ